MLSLTMLIHTKNKNNNVNVLLLITIIVLLLLLFQINCRSIIGIHINNINNNYYY